MSGDDTIITANKSVDITSAQNDVRLAAFNNMEIISGISSRGRILIENKGVSSELVDESGENTGGDSVSNTAGQKYKFSTKIQTEDIGEDVATSGILLVAKNSNLATYSQLKYDNAKVAVQDSEQFLSKTIQTALSVGTQLSIFAPRLMTAVGMFATTSLPAPMASTPTNIVNTFFEQYIEGERQLGNDTAIASLGFSFRNVEQYGTSDYIFIAPTYQKTYEIKKEDKEKGKEGDEAVSGGVSAGEDNTGNNGENEGEEKEKSEIIVGIVDYFALDLIYSTIVDETSGPFPGKNRWNNEEAYLTAKLQLVDPLTERAKLGTGDHEEVEHYEEPYKSAPNKSYSATIIES
jgi:hypothetical protein